MVSHHKCEGVINMIQVILGNKGSGKTLKLISLANDSLKDERGNIFFIDSHNRHMYDLHRDIRFVNASEYGLDSIEMFYGMICGMISAISSNSSCVNVRSPTGSVTVDRRPRSYGAR